MSVENLGASDVTPCGSFEILGIKFVAAERTYVCEKLCFVVVDNRGGDRNCNNEVVYDERGDEWYSALGVEHENLPSEAVFDAGQSYFEVRSCFIAIYEISEYRRVGKPNA